MIPPVDAVIGIVVCLRVKVVEEFEPPAQAEPKPEERSLEARVGVAEGVGLALVAIGGEFGLAASSEGRKFPSPSLSCCGLGDMVLEGRSCCGIDLTKGRPQSGILETGRETLKMRAR